MIDCWKREIIGNPEGDLDIYAWNLRLTMDVLGQAAFSHDFTSIDPKGPNDSGLYDAFQTILSTLTVRGIANSVSWPKWWYSLPTPQNLTFNKAITKLNGLCSGLIQQRKKDMDARGPEDAPVA